MEYCRIEELKENNTNLVVGLCGYAGAGKDLFYELLSKKVASFKRFALADELKLDMRDSLLKSHSVDILNCSRREKEVVRHLLIEYGTKKRRLTEGRYWTDKLNEKILPIKEDVCVTDIRYAIHERDEHSWLKNELGGALVWIDQFEVDSAEGARIYKGPPNEEESENGPILKEHADYIVEWEKVKDKSELDKHVNQFVGWLYVKQGRRRYPS